MFFLLDGDGGSDGSGWADDRDSHSKSENEKTPEYPVSGSIGNRDGPALGTKGLVIKEGKGDDKFIGAMEAEVTVVTTADEVAEATGVTMTGMVVEEEGAAEAGAACTAGILAVRGWATIVENDGGVAEDRVKEGPATEATVAAATGVVVKAGNGGERGDGVAYAIGVVTGVDSGVMEPTVVTTASVVVVVVSASGTSIGIGEISRRLKSKTIGLSTR